MSRARSSAGDTIPTECRPIEVRVGELRRLFNAIDPSPFPDKSERAEKRRETRLFQLGRRGSQSPHCSLHTHPEPCTPAP